MRPTLRRLFPLLLILITALAYVPALRARFIWDDDAYLTNNPTLTQPDALRRIWLVPEDSPQYYPLVFTVLLAEKSAFGVNPLPFHALNILLHAGSAILFWLVLRRLKVPGAAFAAAIFAIHPVAVETVAWVTELKNTLSCFLALSALLAWLPFGLPDRPAIPPAIPPALPPGPPPPPRRWKSYALSLALFLLAMLSKSVACGLAPTLLILLWWKKPRLTRSDLLALLPYFVVGALLGWNTAHLEANHVGATGADFALSPLDRVLLAGRVICFYAAKDLLPVHLAFFYPRWGIDVRVWWQYLFPAAVVAVLIALFLLRRRLGRGPLAAAAIFVAVLFPALGFINFFPMLFSFVADHLQYLALLPFCALVGATLATLWPARRHMAAVAAAIPVLVLLAWQTSATAAHYHDPETLWTSVAAEDSHWMALQALAGMELAQASAQRAAGASADAVRPLITQVLTLNQQVAAQRPNRGEVANNNAEAYLLLDNLPAAEEQARKAISLSPELFITHLTLAKVLQAKGDTAGALVQLHAAIDAQPERPEPHAALAAFFLHDQLPQADVEFTLAAELRPAADAWSTVGYVRSIENRLAAARDAYRRALEIEPLSPDANDGLARATALDPVITEVELQLAANAAESACRLSPNPRYLDTLGLVQYRLGNLPAAIAAARKALAAASAQDRPLLQHHLDLYTAAPASRP